MNENARAHPLPRLQSAFISVNATRSSRVALVAREIEESYRMSFWVSNFKAISKAHCFIIFCWGEKRIFPWECVCNGFSSQTALRLRCWIRCRYRTVLEFSAVCADSFDPAKSLFEAVFFFTFHNFFTCKPASTGFLFHPSCALCLHSVNEESSLMQGRRD